MLVVPFVLVATRFFWKPRARILFHFTHSKLAVKLNILVKISNMVGNRSVKNNRLNSMARQLVAKKLRF